MSRGRAVNRLLLLVSAIAALAGVRLAAAGEDARTLPAVLTDAIARYATLTSYADTGTVSEEVAGMIHETKVTTSFRRATRDFYLDYHPLRTRYPKLNGYTTDSSVHRMVFWMLKGQLQTYSYYFKRHTPAAADQAGTLRSGIPYTAGTSVLIPSLLYPSARLPGTPLQFEQASLAGTETLAGHRCHKITGEAAEYYPSGQRTNVRRVTLLIDAESQLIRRIVEEKPTGDGTPHRLTVTLDPLANPTLDDARFSFAVPPSK